LHFGLPENTGKSPSELQASPDLPAYNGSVPRRRPAMKRPGNLHRLELLVGLLMTLIDLQQALRDLLPP